MHPLFAGILSVYLCFAGLKMIMAAYNNDHTRQQKTCDPLPYTLFPLVLITLSRFHYPHYFSARPVLDKLPTCLASIIAIFPFLTLPVCFPHRLALPSIVWTVLMRRNSTERRKLDETLRTEQRVDTGHEGTETVFVMHNAAEQHYSVTGTWSPNSRVG